MQSRRLLVEESSDELKDLLLLQLEKLLLESLSFSVSVYKLDRLEAITVAHGSSQRGTREAHSQGYRQIKLYGAVLMSSDIILF